MTEEIGLPEGLGKRPDVPKIFQDAFKIKPIEPRTGLEPGLIPTPEDPGLLVRVREKLAYLVSGFRKDIG